MGENTANEKLNYFSFAVLREICRFYGKRTRYRDFSFSRIFLRLPFSCNGCPRSLLEFDVVFVDTVRFFIILKSRDRISIVHVLSPLCACVAV